MLAAAHAALCKSRVPGARSSQGDQLHQQVWPDMSGLCCAGVHHLQHPVHRVHHPHHRDSLHHHRADLLPAGGGGPPVVVALLHVWRLHRSPPLPLVPAHVACCVVCRSVQSGVFKLGGLRGSWGSVPIGKPLKECSTDTWCARVPAWSWERTGGDLAFDGSSSRPVAAWA